MRTTSPQHSDLPDLHSGDRTSRLCGLLHAMLLVGSRRLTMANGQSSHPLCPLTWVSPTCGLNTGSPRTCTSDRGSSLPTSPHSRTQTNGRRLLLCQPVLNLSLIADRARKQVNAPNVLQRQHTWGLLSQLARLPGSSSLATSSASPGLPSRRPGSENQTWASLSRGSPASSAPACNARVVF